jgi:hypothetical protein
VSFSDAAKQTAWEGMSQSDYRDFFEVVRVGDVGYVVLLRTLSAMGGKARMSTVHPTSREVQGISFVKGTKAERIQAKSVWTILDKEEPLTVVYSSGRLKDMVGIALDGHQLTYSGPQEGHLAQRGTETWAFVDGIPLIQQCDRMAPDRMPVEMPGRKKATVAAGPGYPESQGVAFVKPNLKLPVPEEVLAVLRQRYHQVEPAPHAPS